MWTLISTPHFFGGYLADAARPIPDPEGTDFTFPLGELAYELGQSTESIGVLLITLLYPIATAITFGWIWLGVISKAGKVGPILRGTGGIALILLGLYFGFFIGLSVVLRGL